MTKTNKSLMTAALGGLMLAATMTTASAEDANTTAPDAGGGRMGECHGINSCKGTGACHGADNSCAGKNACKGKAWIKATQSDCEAKGGKFKE